MNEQVYTNTLREQGYSKTNSEWTTIRKTYAIRIADTIDSLRAENAELNRRIAELEAQLPKPPKLPETVVYEGGKPPRQYLREGD